MPSSTMPPAVGSTPTASPADGSVTGHGHSEEDAAGELTPERKELLGLGSGREAPDSLAPLSQAQWADPEVVAARYVLVDTNYSAGDTPGAVNARRAEYAADRLKADLAVSSSAGAGIDDLRRQGGELHGEILRLTTSERSDDMAAVTLMVRRTVTIDGRPVGASRIGFHRITLFRNPSNGRWLVVRVELS